jgi:hypothetical protein
LFFVITSRTGFTLLGFWSRRLILFAFVSIERHGLCGRCCSEFALHQSRQSCHAFSNQYDAHCWRFIYTGFSATGNLGSTYQAFTGFNGAGVAVPIWKTVFATGIYPYSRLDYNQRQIGRLELPETDTTALEYRYRGIGD